MSRRDWKRVVFALVMITVLALGMVVQASTLPNSAEWNGRQGVDSERCDKLGESPQRTEAGWIHWIVNRARGITEAELVLGGSGSGTYYPTKYGPVVEFYTPYFDVWTLTATLNYAGTWAGNFVISDYCPGVFEEELTVTKTVDTSFMREHKWSIAKSVTTDKGYLLCTTHAYVHLYADGTGDELVEWIIDVTYEGYDDSDWNVSGTITIENTGLVDAVITDVDDVLGGTSIDVDCPVTFPYTLPMGETLTCTYDEDGYFEGDNVVTVTTARDSYWATEAIVWGDPTTELYKTINVEDESYLHHGLGQGTTERSFDPVTAPNNAQFSYETHVTYEVFGALCDLPPLPENEHWWWHNTATIVETGQSVTKYLVIHVLCPVE